MRTAGRLLVVAVASVAAHAAFVGVAVAEHAADDGLPAADTEDARPVSSPSEVDPPPRRRSGRVTSGDTAKRVAIAPATVPVGAAGAPSSHVVEPGQTLSSIARLHGCAVADLQKANAIDGALIRPGQRLTVPPCVPGRLAPIPLVAGQSIGQPWNGSLQAPAVLPAGDGYHIRRPHRAFGASHVVAHIQRAVAAVRTRFPGVHTLAIGDLSARRGGAITEHRSHQSGRDVDIGLYYSRVPRGYPQSFVTDVASIDLAATWALLHAFARTADEPGGVAAIFLDFDVQGRLYEWALDHGVPADYLQRLFQYPHGEGAMAGLVRHEPNHADHLHIRFKCPPDDERCW